MSRHTTAELSQELTSSIETPSHVSDTLIHLHRSNHHLHRELNYYKTMISKATLMGRSWNVCKKMANEYELVCSGSAGGLPTLTPTSRSFFKMWEMIKEKLLDVLSQRRPLAMAFLAEAPGGFVESVILHRTSQGCSNSDQMHCITLTSSHAPGWSRNIHQTSVTRASSGVLKIHYGVDGTGNLYNIANIDDFIQATGGDGCCDLVTADGGFDVSSDYNCQELLTFRLILCEAYTMLRLQAPGGSGVLKIFDVAHTSTQRLIQVLCSAYRHVHIMKPLTSRPANSEKYIICTEFVGVSPRTLYLLRAKLVLASEGAHPLILPRMLSLRKEHEFMKQLMAFNHLYIRRQIHYIKMTLIIIQKTSSNSVPTHQFNKIRDIYKTYAHIIQMRHAMQWCINYGIPFKNSMHL